MFNVLCHELLEVIITVLSYRYSDPSTSTNYKFFMDHKEFENVVQIFSSVITKFL